MAKDAAQVRRLVVAMCGRLVCGRFGPADLRACERARQVGFIVGRECSWQRVRVWWAWCSAADWPFVWVIPRGAVAEVRYDLFTTAYDLTPQVQTVACAAVRCAGSSAFGVGAAAGHAVLLRQVAEPLARVLVGLAQFIPPGEPRTHSASKAGSR